MSEAQPQPETLSFREFATRIGCKPGYVTQLRKAGRLVLSDDKRRVMVTESLSLIEDTRDPAKAGVAARHAAKRAQTGTVATTDSDTTTDPPPTTFAPEDPHTRRRAKALADKAEADARQALRDEQRELGELLSTADVVATVTDAITTLRSSLENLPGQIAGALAAAQTEEQARVLLADALETRMGELARKLATIGKGE